METKECTYCHEEKSMNDFHKNKRHQDGRDYYCKACRKAIYIEKEYYKKNNAIRDYGFIKKPKPIIVKEGVEGKECTRCGEWKPLTEYHKFRRMTYGLNIYCKKCDRSAKREYFQTEKGKNNSHNASAKRRAKKKGVKFTRFQRTAILKRDKYTCQECGIKVHDRSKGDWNTPDKAHIDHIVSLEDGGTWDEGNLQTLCRTCNLEKGATSKGVVQLSFF
jgi:5-methylcytosine-specific restriction endonuclease McrA